MSVIRTGVEVRIREADLTDPTCGLRAGLVDVALTRGPFNETGPTVHELRADDPLARRDRLKVADLADRGLVPVPGRHVSDLAFVLERRGAARGSGGTRCPGVPAGRALERNSRHCPVRHDLPRELAVVPLIDIAPSRVVAAWNEGDPNPLVRSFAQIATVAYWAERSVAGEGMACPRAYREWGRQRSAGTSTPTRRPAP